MEQNLDYYGNDILLKRKDTKEACIDLCVSTEGGLFWTWYNDHCWVKSSDSGRRPHSVAVSGNKQCGIGGTLPQPAVVWSESINVTHSVEQLFIDNGNNWLAPTSHTGHAFTIKLFDCKINVAGVRLKNTMNGELRNRAVRKFRVSGFQEGNSRWHWVQLLQEELENPLSTEAPPSELETFYFSEVVQLQLLKFDLDSFWGTLGGGLEYFAVITVSDLCKSSEFEICPPYSCGSPAPLKRKPAGVDCPCNRNCTESLNGNFVTGWDDSLGFSLFAAVVLGALIALVCLVAIIVKVVSKERRRKNRALALKMEPNPYYGIEEAPVELEQRNNEYEYDSFYQK